MVAVLSRRAWLIRAPLGGAALAAGTAGGIPLARARVHGDYAYTWAQVWQTTVRMVRVDLQRPINDRDEAIGYVMFDYREAGRVHAGSVELVRTTGEGGNERVRVVVQVPSLPSWVERMILDRLTRKLREDFGEPPRLARPVRTEREPAPADPEPAPDANEDPRSPSR